MSSLQAKFYAWIDGKQCGPFSAAHLHDMAASGRLRPHDQVQQLGSTTWWPASAVHGLFSAPPLSPPTTIPTEPPPLAPNTAVPPASNQPTPSRVQPVEESERTLFELKPSPKAFLGDIIRGMIPALVIGVVVFALGEKSWGVILAFGVAGLAALRVWLKTVSVKYKLINQRLVVIKELVTRQIQELELYRAKDVTVNQGFVQRLLDVGTITVLSTDDTSPSVHLIGMPKPVEVKEIIRTLYQRARKREGVRTTELIPS